MPVRELNRELDWNLPDEDATTIAGLVIHEARHHSRSRPAFRLFRLQVRSPAPPAQPDHGAARHAAGQVRSAIKRGSFAASASAGVSAVSDKRMHRPFIRRPARHRRGAGVPRATAPSNAAETIRTWKWVSPSAIGARRAGMAGMACAFVHHIQRDRARRRRSVSRRMLSATLMPLNIASGRRKVKQYLFLFFTPSLP